ncbi:Uncharacterised protein [Actinobaculum suis]|uniref:Uncharacterized protein n=1 Tax=Actinobaculum suis TaxID=1657 RepID=A0A7Z8Y9X3_9ACTO|nr:ABC transporter permease [Actinobaculum suis]VDG76142.1 Uncharacterised protein [Actinobaculum suis]
MATEEKSQFATAPQGPASESGRTEKGAEDPASYAATNANLNAAAFPAKTAATGQESSGGRQVLRPTSIISAGARGKENETAANTGEPGKTPGGKTANKLGKTARKSIFGRPGKSAGKQPAGKQATSKPASGGASGETASGGATKAAWDKAAGTKTGSTAAAVRESNGWWEILTGALAIVLAWFVWDRAKLVDSPYSTGTLFFSLGLAVSVVLLLIRRMLGSRQVRRTLALIGLAVSIAAFVLGLIFAFTASTDQAATQYFFSTHLLDVTAPAIVDLIFVFVFLWFSFRDNRATRE